MFERSEFCRSPEEADSGFEVLQRWPAVKPRKGHGHSGPIDDQLLFKTQSEITSFWISLVPS